MPTRTTNDLFAPRAPVSREQLEHYVRGELSPGEAFEVERCAEADPLLRDALNGLMIPGALRAANSLRTKHRPASGKGWMFGAGVLLLAIGAGLWLLASNKPGPVKKDAPIVVSTVVQMPEQQKRTDSVLNVVHAEWAEAEPLPAPRQAAHSEMERFVVHDSIPQAEPVGVKPIILAHDPAQIGPAAHSAARPSRKLVFLHDLKLVHPQELYGTRFPEIPSPGLAANAEAPVTGSRGAPVQPEVRSYIDFMDEALGSYVRGDQHAALDDLYFLLGQYPKDVNARFYAGLCCYDLGLFGRASALLEGVRADTVDTFNEEAAWYEALSIAGKDGEVAAKDLYRNIAGQGGFYAAQARKKLQAE